MSTMATSTFTTRIDSELKAELERIARAERRSASFIANQAIENLVEERRATRELVQTGLMLLERGAPTIPAEDIHAWMLSEDEEAPFPSGRASS
jgi:predicted transcriptional regulator